MQFHGQGMLGFGAGPDEFVGIDDDQCRQSRNAGQGDGGIVSDRCGVEALAGDLEADKDENRQEGWLRDQFVDIAERPRQPRSSHQQGCGQRVGGPSPHRLVGRVTDVGCRLDHPAAEAGDERRHRFDTDDLRRVIFVTGGCGAFSTVNAADHRAEGERDDDGKVRDGIGDRFQPFELEGRKPVPRPEGGGRIKASVGRRWDPSGGRSQPPQTPAHQHGSERPGEASRQPDAGGECGEHDSQCDKAHHRSGQNLHRWQEADQDQRDGRQRPQQARSGDGPPHEPREWSAGEFEDSAGDDPTHAHMPGMSGRRQLVEALPESGLESRTEHEKHHPECARGVESQRHRRDVGASGPPGELYGHPGERQVSQDNADRGARDEVGKGKLRRIAEHACQEADREDKVGNIVDRQAEKGVDVARCSPAVAVRRNHC